MKIGQTIPQILLPAVDGSQFDSNSLRDKKYLLTFFRFATCPFCNMRIAQLVKTKHELGDDFEIVAIFESEIEHLTKHATKHLAKFPILADYNREYYELFGVKKSLLGMLKGMIFRIPMIIKAMFKGFLPHEISSRFFNMPLSVLVDRQGVIQAIYHSKDEGDHMPIEQIMKFARKND